MTDRSTQPIVINASPEAIMDLSPGTRRVELLA
jgi:hypothetical protein